MTKRGEFYALGGAVFAYLLLASTTAGQDLVAGAPSPQANSSDLCNVEGIVVSATTGEGLRKINVNLMRVQGQPQSYSSVTDISGHFVFNGMVPGQYALSAGGDGYPQQQYGSKQGHPGGKVLVLPAGCHENSLVFRLSPPGVITGTVRDEDGDPVIGGQVQALRIGRIGHREQISSGGFAQTNDLGQYRVYGLEPGHYFVVARHQRQAPGGASAEEVYLPTFYPAASDASHATALQVSPGDEVSGVDVNLKTVHSVRICGRILTDIPTKTLRGLYVSAIPRESLGAGYMGGNFGAPTVDDGGNFEIDGVPPGSYVLFAGLNDAGRSYTGRTLVETGDSGADGVILEVGSAAALRGRVQASPGAELDFSKLSVSLQPEENYFGGAGAQVKADGTFVLENLSEGSYQLNIAGFPEEFYIQSARFGGSDVLASGLTVRHHDALDGLEIVLSKDGGRVDGVVLNDHQPVGGAHVVLVPDPPNRGRGDLFSWKTADPTGRFSLLGLPPGDFKIFAWEQSTDVNYSDQDFMKDYEDRGTHVHIEEKEDQSVQLDVIPDDDGR